MKRKTLAVLLLVMALISAMMVTACGSKPAEKEETPTLESFMNENPDVKDEIDKKVSAGETNGVAIDISGNDIIYTFDLKGMDDMTDEFAKSDELKQNLQAALDEQSATFTGIADSLESTVSAAGTEIKGVRVVVKYVYGDEELTSSVFEASAE